MRRTKPEPTFLPTQGTFNLPHHIGMIWGELVFIDAVSYTQQEKWIAAQLNVMAVAKILTPIPSVTRTAPKPTEPSSHPEAHRLPVFVCANAQKQTMCQGWKISAIFNVLHYCNTGSTASVSPYHPPTYSTVSVDQYYTASYSSISIGQYYVAACV